MRPRPLAHSWLLAVAASLLMMMVEGQGPAPITVDNICPAATPSCLNAVVDPPSVSDQSRAISCDTGYVLESTILDDSQVPFVLKETPTFKAVCYSKCHRRYHKNICEQPTICAEASHGDTTLTCSDNSKPLLVVNGVERKLPITCSVTGWKDSAGFLFVDFANTKKDNHFIVSLCKELPPAPPPVPTECDASSYEKDCKPPCQIDYDQPSGKLSCPGSSKLLVFGSKLFDHAICTDKGWTGHVGNSKEQLIDFGVTSLSKIRAKCHTFDCNLLFKCPSRSPRCTKPVFVNSLQCTTGFLSINGAFLKEAQCSESGWTSNGQTLLAYTTFPYKEIEAECKIDCDASLFEDVCPKGACDAKPSFDNKKRLSCSDNNHFLMVDHENNVKKPLTCSSKGWKEEGSTGVVVLDYKTEIKKLKVKCLSRCHTTFIDRECTGQGCTKPIYINEGEPLFCRSADYQLVLNGKDVPDVVCDKTAGWREAGKPAGAILVAFKDYKGAKPNTVKASCKPKPIPSTPTPPIISNSNETSKNNSNNSKEVGTANVIETSGNNGLYIGIIVVLVLVIVGGILLFFYLIQKKKNTVRSDDEEPSKTKTTSDSRNNSVKTTKKGKKGKKNSKKNEVKSSKKRKNGKKGKGKISKKEEAMEVNSNVEVPEHQMSLHNGSAMALTAALAPQVSNSNPNVIDI